MKVLIASHLFPNRQEPLKGVFVREFARALQGSVDVEVMAPLPAFPLLRPYADVPAQDQQSGVRVFHPKYVTLPGVLFGWRWQPYFRASRQWIRSQDSLPDLVHVHWLYPDGYAVVRWAREMGIKVVLTVHGHAAFGWFGDKRQWRFYKDALTRADHVISVSGEIKDKLVSHFGVEESRVSVIHNGVDATRFPLDSKEGARRKLGLPLNKKILLSVARLAPEKGLHRLIEQVKRCRGRYDWQLHIAGGGPLEGALRKQIAELGLESRVLLEGGVPHEQLHEWYAAADLFCLSSFHEGCPVVVHEALACGLPVVSTSVGAVPDFLTAGASGLLCDPGKDPEIGDQIIAALGREWDREGIAARWRGQTWERVAAETIDIYRRVLSAPENN